MSENRKADEKRDAYLNSLGITVLRYPNTAINKNFNSVCEDILSHLELIASDLKFDNKGK